MARVIWSDQAVAQIDAIVDYIELFDVAAAGRTAKRLIALGESLETFSNRGRPASGNARELTTVPPYILRYEVVGEAVRILGVRHGARMPESD